MESKTSIFIKKCMIMIFFCNFAAEKIIIRISYEKNRHCHPFTDSFSRCCSEEGTESGSYIYKKW